MEKMLATATLTLALAACASGPSAPPKAWYRTGATEREFNMDFARCKMGVASIQGRAPLPYSGVGTALSQAGRDMQDDNDRLSYIFNCMTAQGWDWH